MAEADGGKCGLEIDLKEEFSNFAFNLVARSFDFISDEATSTRHHSGTHFIKNTHEQHTSNRQPPTTNQP